MSVWTKIWGNARGGGGGSTIWQRIIGLTSLVNTGDNVFLGLPGTARGKLHIQNYSDQLLIEDSDGATDERFTLIKQDGGLLSIVFGNDAWDSWNNFFIAERNGINPINSWIPNGNLGIGFDNSANPNARIHVKVGGTGQVAIFENYTQARTTIIDQYANVDIDASSKLLTNLIEEKLVGGGINFNPANMNLGDVDVFSRLQMWFKANGTYPSIFRMGSLSADGDPTDISSEGIVVNGSGFAGGMGSNNWTMARIKSDRFGLQTAIPGYQFYWFRVDRTNFYLKDDTATTKFSVDRLTGNTIISGDVELKDDKSLYLDTAKTISLKYDTATGVASFKKDDGLGNSINVNLEVSGLRIQGIGSLGVCEIELDDYFSIGAAGNVDIESTGGDMSIFGSGGELYFNDSRAVNIPLSEVGTTGLVGFTAVSILGALNELKAGIPASIWQDIAGVISPIVATDILSIAEIDMADGKQIYFGTDKDGQIYFDTVNDITTFKSSKGLLISDSDWTSGLYVHDDQLEYYGSGGCEMYFNASGEIEIKTINNDSINIHSGTGSGTALYLANNSTYTNYLRTIGVLVFKDKFLSADISLSETGITGLSYNAKTSICGVISELAGGKYGFGGSLAFFSGTPAGKTAVSDLSAWADITSGSDSVSLTDLNTKVKAIRDKLQEALDALQSYGLI